MSLARELDARIVAADPDGKLSDAQAADILTAFVQEKTVARMAEFRTGLDAVAKAVHGGDPTEEDRFGFLIGLLASLYVQFEIHSGRER